MEQKQLDTDRGQSKALTQKLYGQRIDQRYIPYLEYKLSCEILKILRKIVLKIMRDFS